MTPNKVIASGLAAVLAISGIGSILIAQHEPSGVNAVELTTEREGPPPGALDAIDPAIRRDDDAFDGLEALDDDDRDDPTGDGVTPAGESLSVDGQPSIASAAGAASAPSAPSKASAASAPSKASAASAPSAPSAPSKASAPSAPSKASAPSAPSKASAPSADSASADSDD